MRLGGSAGCSLAVVVAVAGAMEGSAWARPPDDVRRPWLARQRGLTPASTSEAPSEAMAEPPATGASSAECDGTRFHFGLSLGTGYFSASNDDAEDQRSFSGLPIGIRVALGASLGASTRLDLAYRRDEIVGLAIEDRLADGDEPGTGRLSLYLQTVGPYVSFSPWGPEGFRFGLGAGLTGLGVRGVDTDEPGGAAFLASAGYDWIFDEDWTWGVSARWLYAQLTVDEVGRSVGVEVSVPSVAVGVSFR